MIPKTLMGLLGLMIFVGYLVTQLYSPGDSQDILATEKAQEAQNSLQDATRCISGGNTSNSNVGTVSNCQGQWFGAIGAFFTIIYSILVIAVTFIVGIFVSFTTFISVVLAIPLVISQLFIALVSVGLILSILSKAIDI